MDIPETKLMLEQVAHYDHRDITDRMVTDWQHALVRLPVEAVFDAIHDHFERCNAALGVPLIPHEVLVHARQARERAEAAATLERARDRNEHVFQTLADHRTTTDRDRAVQAMRAGRAELEQHLASRRHEPEGATHG